MEQLCDGGFSRKLTIVGACNSHHGERKFIHGFIPGHSLDLITFKFIPGHDLTPLVGYRQDRSTRIATMMINSVWGYVSYSRRRNLAAAPGVLYIDRSRGHDGIFQKLLMITARSD